MIAKLLRAGLLIAAIAVAGCTASELEKVSSSGGAKANKQLSQKIMAEMKAKGMSRTLARHGAYLQGRGQARDLEAEGQRPLRHHREL